MRTRTKVLNWLLTPLLLTSPALAGEKENALWSAARRGDAAAVECLLNDGADVNAKTGYGATALSYACWRGHAEVVQKLLDAGADVNVADSFYKATPLAFAAAKGHAPVVRLLLTKGAEGAADALTTAASQGAVEVVKAILESAQLKPEALAPARAAAQATGRADVVEILAAAGAPAAEPSPPPKELPVELLHSYAGAYRNEQGNEIVLEVKDGKLAIGSIATDSLAITAKDDVTFDTAFGSTVTLKTHEGRVVGLAITSGATTTQYIRAAAGDRISARPPRENATVESPTSPNWPSFRGHRARGVAEGQHPPTTWDVESSTNIRWKTPIPGLGHSCPVVWENKVFITTAVGREQAPLLRTGQYGDVDTVENETEHAWWVYCLDKPTGRIVWQRTVHEGMPAVKRHLKSTHANATPATDGRFLVVSFGSEGLYCFDLDGNLLWRNDLGVLDSGWFYDPSYQWEFGSSPVIDRDSVIVQCDIQQGSFIAAYDLATGTEKWRTARDEIPSWGTPTVVETEQGAMVVTNATRFARGYDAATGEELWRLAGNSEITVPTPFTAHGLIFVASGYRPIQPIYAVKPDARGEISTEPAGETGCFLAWHVKQGGPYMPTPIVYGDYLYVCGNGGILVCYDALTGERLYRKRLVAGGGSFVASPVAADGKLYFTAEDGEVQVVKAGAEFELLATNKLGDFCLSTPAISEGLFIARTGHHVIAAGEPENGDGLPK